MLDPASNLLPPPSSPTNSSVSSSDLDTESTGSFFHDRSTTLGTLMGVTFPSITFRAPSQRRQSVPPPASAVRKEALGAVAERRKRRWWSLCCDGDESKRRRRSSSSLGEFLEVERRLGDVAYIGGDLDGRTTLFAGGRVLPPVRAEESPPPVRFPIYLPGICRSGA